jgi:hypothetical protein
MKKYAVLLGMILLLLAGNVGAQSIADDLEQLSLDYEKLAQMKSLLSDMQKGYTIISEAYEGVKSVSEGNFNVHKVFLDALLAISPAVQNYEKVVDIINTQSEIVKEYKAANTRFNSAGVFNPNETNYIGAVYSNLINRSLKCLEELTMVITAGQMRMSDGQRLAAIDRIDRDAQDQLGFLRYFNDNTSVQALQRSREANDMGTVKSLYGIGN